MYFIRIFNIQDYSIFKISNIQYSKIFLNLEEQHALLNQVRILLSGEKEVTDKHKINEELECFYKNLFIEISEKKI